MSANSGRVILAFIAGQVVQIILSVVAKNCFMLRPILFCGAAGFLVLVAVFAGIKIGLRDEVKVPKSYDYYATRK